jgi:site-specific DNA-adenine methylase
VPQLKPGATIKYGIPYQGSKTKIIEKIARFFPNADNFYDLFGGGFSVTHYMMEHRRKSFKNFHYNELRSGLCELIRDAIDGKYNYDVFKPEWISRERFMRDKESNAYIKIIWSFGNNGEGYLFGQDIENEKRSMHMAVVFDEFDEWFKQTFSVEKWPKGLDITGKRLYLKKAGREKMRLPNERQQLQQLERLQQLQLTNLDYKKVPIKKSSVIYCDIPYQGTADYGSTFNHKEFFDWAHAQKSPVFISEYEIKDSSFHLLIEFKHRTTFAAGDNSEVTERLYGNRIAYDIIQKALGKGA